MHKDKNKHEKPYIFSFNNSLKNSISVTPESSKYSFYKSAMYPFKILSLLASNHYPHSHTIHSQIHCILSFFIRLIIKRTNLGEESTRVSINSFLLVKT